MRQKYLFRYIMHLFCMVAFHTSCSVGGSGQVDEIFGGSTIGDSAFTASPSSVDFGPVAVFNNLSRAITIKNSSRFNTYISSIATNVTVFQVTSDTCARSPAAIKPDETCSVVIKFNPTTAGALGAAVAVRYGTKDNNSGQYVTNFGVSGTGVSPLIFSGLQSLGPQTNKTMTLSWTLITTVQKT